MKFVYYSLVLTSESATYQKQWLRSIRSLRQFNRTIPVHLFVFNEPAKALLDLADLYEVTVHHPGSYSDCMRAIGGEVDDPPLAHAEDAVEPAAGEQSEVGERAESPVSDQDVARTEFRV